MVVLHIICVAAAFLVLLTAFELVRLNRIKSLPDLPDKSEADKYSLNINSKSFEDLYLYLSGKQTEPSFSEVKIYYGASDTVECMATANVNDLIKLCLE